MAVFLYRGESPRESNVAEVAVRIAAAEACKMAEARQKS
jgi:hypothetical protein